MLTVERIGRRRVRLPVHAARVYGFPSAVRELVAASPIVLWPGHIEQSIRVRSGPCWPRRHSVKRTFQPNNRRRARRHGFRHRMADRAGQAIVKSRRRKGRHRLSA